MSMRDRDIAYVQHLLDAARATSPAYSFVGNKREISSAKCLAPDCGREFLGLSALQDHAESVHTFEDIRRILSEHIREEFGRRGDYKVEPIVPAVWTYIDDLAADWVVYCVEEGNDTKLLKASYAISDGKVTLGDSVEVRRRTVFEPIKRD